MDWSPRMNRRVDPDRRLAVALLFCGGALAAFPAFAAAPTLTVHKTPWCGCCGAWVERMRAAGFTRVKVQEHEDLAPVRRRLGIGEALASCHTGEIGGYALEGHVPPADVRRLLNERPSAAGLAVPGMPAGSPGMETPDGRRQPFSTLLVMRDGKSRVYARHG